MDSAPETFIAELPDAYAVSQGESKIERARILRGERNMKGRKGGKTARTVS